MDFLEELPVKSKDEIAKLNTNSLDSYVKECSTRILESIARAEDKLEQAKNYGYLAESMESGGLFGGKTKRKTDMTAIALSQTNDAMNELTLLQRETIQFICVSLAFAQKMNESISYMIEYGFKDRDGQVQHLTDDSKKIARKILDESQKYAQNQLEQQEKDLAQDKHLNKLEGKISHISELNKHHEQKFQEHDQKFQEKDELDEKQDHNISVLKATVKQLKNDEIANISKFDNEINSLEIKLKELKENFDKLIESRKKSDEIEAEVKNISNGLPQDFKKDFSNLFAKYVAENKKSAKEIDDKLNDAKINLIKQIDDIKKQESKLELRFNKIKPASKFPIIAGIIAIVLGAGAFVSVFLPLKVYIENENRIISTRLTNYVNDNNESLKSEFNNKIDSITGNASENKSQISLLTGQLSELKNDYQKSVEEYKAFLNTSEYKITALSEKIEKQNNEMQLLVEKLSSYENNTKSESLGNEQTTEFSTNQTEKSETEVSVISIENSIESQAENQNLTVEKENQIAEESNGKTENAETSFESETEESKNDETQISEKNNSDSKTSISENTENIEKPKQNIFLKILKIVGIIIGVIILLGIILVIIGSKLS